MISTLKSLILTTFVKKKSPRGEPPTGSHLRRWSASGGPLRGGKKAPKKRQILKKHFSVLDRSSPTIPEPHP